jgi:hypothetical protein
MRSRSYSTLKIETLPSVRQSRVLAPPRQGRPPQSRRPGHRGGPPSTASSSLGRLAIFNHVARRRCCRSSHPQGFSACHRCDLDQVISKNSRSHASRWHWRRRLRWMPSSSSMTRRASPATGSGSCQPMSLCTARPLMISCTVPVQPEASSLMTSTARLHAGQTLGEPLDHGGFVSQAALFAEVENLAALDRDGIMPRHLLDGLTAIAERARVRRHRGSGSQAGTVGSGLFLSQRGRRSRSSAGPSRHR